MPQDAPRFTSISYRAEQLHCEAASDEPLETKLPSSQRGGETPESSFLRLRNVRCAIDIPIMLSSMAPHVQGIAYQDQT